jgi:hypothetical protein
MIEGKKVEGWLLPPRAGDSDAVFMGWQRTSWGELFPLYNITAEGHPSCGSTVTGASLIKMDLQIPQTPIPPVKRR